MQNNQEYNLFDAAATTGVSKVIYVGDWESVVLSFDTDGGADAALTAKIVGAITEEAPDFSAAQAADNRYDFIQAVDLEDGSSIDGDDGFVVATADNHVNYEVNTSRLRWLAVKITARTEGELTVNALVGDKQ